MIYIYLMENEYHITCSYGLENLKRTQKVLFDMLVWLNELFQKNDIRYFLSDGTLLGCIRHQNFIPWDDDVDICIIMADYERAMELILKNLPSEFALESKLTDPNYFLNFNKLIYVKSKTHNEAYHSLNNFKWQGVALDLFRCWEDKRSHFATRQRVSFGWLLRTRYVIRTGHFSTKLKGILFLLYKVPVAIFWWMVDKLAPKYDAYSTDPDDQTIPLGTNDVFPLRIGTFNGKQFPIPQGAESFLERAWGDYMRLPKIESRVAHYDRVEFFD